MAQYAITRSPHYVGDLVGENYLRGAPHPFPAPSDLDTLARVIPINTFASLRSAHYVDDHLPRHEVLHPESPVM
jgi:hypothetical protein